MHNHVLCLFRDCGLLESLSLFLLNFAQRFSIISRSLVYFDCILLRFPMCLKQRAEWEMEEACDISSVKHLDRKTLKFLRLLPSKNKRIYSLVLHHLKFTMQDGFHPNGREQSYCRILGNLVS